MKSIRRIKKVSRSKATIEGAGVHLKRAFGFQQEPDLDPFLLLDDFHSDNPDIDIKQFSRDRHKSRHNRFPEHITKWIKRCA